MYRMIVYTNYGELWLERYASELEYFDRYKNKKNYRIVIKKRNKILYSEV